MLVPEVKLINLKKIFLVADLGLLLKKERLLLKTNSGQSFWISCFGAPCFLLASHLSITTGGRFLGEGLEMGMQARPRQVKASSQCSTSQEEPLMLCKGALHILVIGSIRFHWLGSAPEGIRGSLGSALFNPAGCMSYSKQ